MLPNDFPPWKMCQATSGMLTSPEQPNWLGMLFLFIPIIIGIFGFIFSIIGCLLYDLIASKVGGVEFILEDVESE